MKVGIYLRVSTTDKDQTPETQALPVREYVAAHGWQVVGEFTDTVSATDIRGRRAWQELLGLAARRKVDGIVVYKLDRAFRSVRHASTTLEDLRRHGVFLQSVTEPWADTASPQGELVFNLLATFAQFERSLIAERVRSGMARARKQGKHLGRPRTLNGEWETVRPRVAAGQMSQREAARVLRVSPRTVGRLLRVTPAVGEGQMQEWTCEAPNYVPSSGPCYPPPATTKSVSPAGRAP